MQQTATTMLLIDIKLEMQEMQTISNSHLIMLENVWTCNGCVNSQRGSYLILNVCYFFLYICINVNIYIFLF